VNGRDVQVLMVLPTEPEGVGAFLGAHSTSPFLAWPSGRWVCALGRTHSAEARASCENVAQQLTPHSVVPGVLGAKYF